MEPVIDKNIPFTNNKVCRSWGFMEKMEPGDSALLTPAEGERFGLLYNSANAACVYRSDSDRKFRIKKEGENGVRVFRVL